MLQLPRRAILRLAGPDTLSLLERTVTHTVAGWQVGEMRYGALLTPQGKILVDYLARRSEAGVDIDVHEDGAGELVRRLTLFRLRAQVEIGRDETLVSVTGPGLGPDPRTALLPEGRGIAAPGSVTGLKDTGSWQAQRILAGIPEWGEDYQAAEVFPTDVNMDLMNGIDYRKGCFVGQEVASRMKRKSLIRKRTVRISLPSAERGQDLMTGGQLLGQVTSAAGGQALALVRVDRLARALEAGEEIRVGDETVSLHRTPWLEEEMTAHLESRDG